MKIHAIAPALAAVCLLQFTAPAAADSNWWNKGESLLKSVTGNPSSAQPGVNEIAGAFKQALTIGAGKVVQQLGKTNGFYKDPAVHIPLPDKLKTVKKALAAVGMSGMMDDLELKLNRAAEAATPKAKKLFVGAIKQMTFDDVMAIYKGPDDSATQYFKKKMSPELGKEMKPIVDKTLSQVGAIQTYDKVMDRYGKLPFVPDVKTNLEDYVVNKGMDGIFHYMAKEEAAIRKDPARQTTELLKKVFGKN